MAVKEAEFDEDIFEAMANGTFDLEEVVDDESEDTTDEEENEGEFEEAGDDEAEELEEDNEDYEDTDQEEDSEDEEEHSEDGDGDLADDSEDEDDDEEENTLVDDDSSDDEDDGTEDEEDKADEADDSEDEDSDEGSEDEAETEDTSDGEDSDTDGIDYKAFYDSVVNTEFVVNGKKTKGFADPQKIIQAQQMAGGFSEKMAGFKQYRPFMAPLKDRGMLDDPAKFDLAMNLVDGDVEAIKAHLKTLQVDPLDLDMEKIEYAPKQATASQEAIIVEETLERAKASGVEDRVRDVLGKEWDAASFQEFVSNDAVRHDLLNHIETGVYDKVQDKMHELSRLDYNGAYGSMTTINKYRAAVQELQKEQAARPPVTETPKPVAKKKPSTKKASIDAEKAKIEKARKDEEYKQKAAAREADIAKQRKKAASMSKKKTKAKPKAKFDPLAVEGEELDDLMDFLITGGR